MTFYDLVDRHGNRYSNYGWRIRMALLHKGIDATVELCCHSDERLGFTGQNLVPVLCHDNRIVCDSWKIALYLDDQFSDRPLLMDGAQATALTHVLNYYVDTKVDAVLVAPLYLDIFRSLHPSADATEFRRKREQRLGETLETLHSRKKQYYESFNKAIAPMEFALRNQPYLSGETPAYADFILYGSFQLALNLCGDDPLASEHTAIRKWRVSIDTYRTQREDALAVGR